MKNLLQTVIDAGNFKTLIKAVQEAELVDTLSTGGPFTLFAPNDQAFAKLPKETIENILRDKEKLTNILTYHVVADKIMSKQVINIKKIQTVNGKNININTKNGVKLDKAKVIKTDIKCTNGVIHVIDQVLIPS
jgi:transforming growth factor-beta-induced protein